MDSSKWDFQSQMTAIKKSILGGRLTHAQIYRILTSEIDKELKKPLEGVDIGYVNVCQSLLECMSQEKASQMKSHSKKNYAAIQAKLRKKRGASQKRIAFRIAIVTVCLLSVFFAADILLTARRIDTSVSPDHEQIIMQGSVLSPNTVDKAEADADDGDIRNLSTDNWSEILKFLDFEPNVPTWLPDGWGVNEYTASILDDYSDFLVIYSGSRNDELLQYAITYYRGSEVVRNEYEQDPASGDNVKINGKDVYVTSNLGSSVAIWKDDSKLHVITGPITKEDVIAMIQSIGKEE